MSMKSASLTGYSTVAEFARLHQVSPVTVALWCRSGRLTAQRFGKSWIIPADAPRPDDGRTTRWQGPG